MKNFKFVEKYKKIKNNIFLKCWFVFLCIIFFKIAKKNIIKVCLCTLGKNENRYARQFVEHYKNLDIDKIFVYDNNDISGEKFEEVLQDYIDNGYVEILNWRGRKKQILNIMNVCY